MITFLGHHFLWRTFRANLALLDKLGVQREPTQYYFGYGANLNPDRLAQNHMKYDVMGPAQLEDYQLEFSIQCQYQGLGYANVAPAPGKQVHGTLFQVDALSLRLLDVMEFAPLAYQRRLLPIRTSEGKRVQAHVYVSQHRVPNLRPSPRYLNLVLAAAEKNHLPESYVAFLKTLKPCSEIKIDHEFTLLTPSRKRLFPRALGPLYRANDRVCEKVLLKLHSDVAAGANNVRSRD